jgi:hypothetical protein
MKRNVAAGRRVRELCFRSEVYAYTVEPIKGLAMPHYRCFFIDLQNHIANVVVGEHADDGVAYGWAADLLAGSEGHLYRAVEVWDGERIVCRHDRRPA